MNYSDDLKVVWLTPMRTGTRASGYLMGKLNFKLTQITNDVPVHSFGIPEGKEDYYLVCNIRNPYSRLVSLFYMYMDSVNNFHLSFDKWVKGNFIHKEEEYNIFMSVRLKKLNKPVDKFIRIEKFEEDILSLPFIKNNIETLKEVIKTNISENIFSSEYENKMGEKRKPWKSFYNQERADILYTKLKCEFDFFNYDKNSWK